jgi:sulfur carrier protein
MLPKGISQSLFLGIPLRISQHKPLRMIYINDMPYALGENNTLLKVFEENNIPLPKGIAVAVNTTVVPRLKWESFIINENDRILIIKATQGG